MKLFKQTLHRFAVLVLCVSLLAGILLPAQAAATFSPAKETPEPTPASAFTVSTAGSITKYSGNDTNIVIPKAINGTTIVSIGAGAFSSVTGVKNIVIPSTVKYVGSLPGEDDLEGVYFYGDCPTGLDGVLEYTYYADVTTIYCKSAYRSNFEGLYGLNGDWEEEGSLPPLRSSAHWRTPPMAGRLLHSITWSIQTTATALTTPHAPTTAVSTRSPTKHIPTMRSASVSAAQRNRPTQAIRALLRTPF